MLELAQLQYTLASAPTAAAHAQAGHLFIKLERYEKARYHLQMAMQLDPNNATGAYGDAYLDTIILDIADDAAGSLGKLQDFGNRYPGSERSLEARYYQAVCHIALEDYKSAGRILETFETKDEDAPEFDSPWTPGALGLLKQLRDYKLY
jgi:hypothetical protein